MLYIKLIASQANINIAALYSCIYKKYNLYFNEVVECQGRKHIRRASLHEAYGRFTCAAK